MSVIKIRKSGTFYQVFDDDCYIFYYLFNYNIINNRVGFPKSAINKVLNELDNKKINYEIIGEDINNNFKKLNKYSKYRELGFNKYNEDIHYSNLINKVKNIPEDKLDIILNYIEEILDD